MIVVGTGLMGIYLTAAAFRDIRSGYIHRWFLALGILPAFLLRIGMGSITIADTVGGIAVGAFFLAVSFISGDRFGKADGIILMYLGTALGFSYVVSLAAVAFVLSAAVIAVLLIFKRIALKGSVPFVPFLLAAYTLVMFTVVG
ncbi:MAG: hypothetical protein K6F93_06935 [Lachnospiraceae bacterium]|nr:hypothetical protein [Lachnospiraceae bacterium]